MSCKSILREIGQLSLATNLSHELRQALIANARQAIAGKEGSVHLMPWRIRKIYIPMLAQGRFPSSDGFVRRLFYARLTPAKLAEDFMLFCRTFLPVRKEI